MSLGAWGAQGAQWAKEAQWAQGALGAQVFLRGTAVKGVMGHEAEAMLYWKALSAAFEQGRCEDAQGVCVKGLPAQSLHTGQARAGP